jgi:hypothetical protein
MRIIILYSLYFIKINTFFGFSRLPFIFSQNVNRTILKVENKELCKYHDFRTSVTCEIFIRVFA